MLGGLVLVLFSFGKPEAHMPTIDHSDFRLVAGDDWRIVGTPHTLVRFQTPLPVSSENSNCLGNRPDRFRT